MLPPPSGSFNIICLHFRSKARALLPSMALANGHSQRLDHQLSPAELFGMISSASQEARLATDSAETSAGGWSHSSSLLSFAQGDQDECDVWIDAMDHSYYQMNQFELRPSRRESNFPPEEQICAAEIASGYSCVSTSPVKKRPSSDNNLPSPKKRCGATRTTIKEKQSPSKDPQSIAAKNRRERISERLKILQELVPNGTKVDLVTMLEKAINYVKFLQLQVKVLATDEFWPAQGGKAPNVAQVREAIDAILSSQRES